MNKFVLTLIIVLALGTAGSCLYKSPLLNGLHPRLASSIAPHTLPRNAVSCGCVAPNPIVPLPPKQAQAEEKREERQEKLENKQIALRLHRLVSIGMARTQVQRLMGEPDMNGSSIAAGHPSDDADYYAEYEVAYSERDTVTWVGSF